MVYVGVVEGSFWAIKAKIYEETGGLDEGTFLYYEENIFAKRLTKLGYHEAVLTKYRYDHFHSVSIKKQYRNKAKAYSNFYKGMNIYLNDYLYCGKIKKIIFEGCYFLGYLERVLYDWVMKLYSK